MRNICEDREVYFKKKCRTLHPYESWYFKKIYKTLSKEDRQKVRDYLLSEKRFKHASSIVNPIALMWGLIGSPVFLIISASLPDNYLHTIAFRNASIGIFCVGVCLQLIPIVVDLLNPYRQWISFSLINPNILLYVCNLLIGAIPIALSVKFKKPYAVILFRVLAVIVAIVQFLAFLLIIAALSK